MNTINNILDIIIRNSQMRQNIKYYQIKNESLMNLGVNSIDFIRIVANIEEELNVTFTDEGLIMNELNTVQDIVEYTIKLK